MTLQSIVVAVDMPGGDPLVIDGKTVSHLERAAEAVAQASIEFKDQPVHFFAVGDEDEVRRELNKHKREYRNTTIVHEPNTVSMEADAKAILRQPSTIQKICDLIKDKKADVGYSSGHSGASVMFASYYFGTLARFELDKPVKVSPLLISAIPCGIDQNFYLSDVGAIKDPEPINLFIGALLTQLYAQVMHNEDTSKSIGILDTKLAKSAQEYFRLFAQDVPIIPIADAFQGRAKVVCTDGFNGNVIIKTVEAVANGVVYRAKNLSRAERFSQYFASSNNKFNTLESHPYMLLACADPAALEQKLYSALDDIDVCEIPPRVGVLSNGEEDVKGNKHAKNLLEQLKKTKLKPIGYVEPADLVRGKARRNGTEYGIDIVVTHPETFSICSGTIEAVEKGLQNMIKEKSTPVNILQYYLSKFSRGLIPGGPLKELKELLNPENHNGSAILGVNGYIVVGHGAAATQAIRAGIRYAIKYRRSNCIERAADYIKTVMSTRND